MRQYTLAAVLAVATASSAFSADLPYKKAPPVIAPVAPAFTWTGAYIGLNAGYVDGHDKAFTEPASSASPRLSRYLTLQLASLGAEKTRLKGSGFTGGGQIGYNYQITPGSGFVIGVETDAQYVDAKRKRESNFALSALTSDVPPLNFTNKFNYVQKDELDFLGTVRGRIGYAFDRVLFYGTGGFAYGNVKYRGKLTDTYSWSDGDSGFGVVTTKSSRIQTGYAYGGGIEYAIPTDSFLNFFRSSAVTVKAEYLHYDLGSRNVVGAFSTGGNTPRNGIGTVTKVSTNGDIFRAGLNYKFGSY